MCLSIIIDLPAHSMKFVMYAATLDPNSCLGSLSISMTSHHDVQASQSGVMTGIEAQPQRPRKISKFCLEFTQITATFTHEKNCSCESCGEGRGQYYFILHHHENERFCLACAQNVRLWQRKKICGKGLKVFPTTHMIHIVYFSNDKY